MNAVGAVSAVETPPAARRDSVLPAAGASRETVLVVSGVTAVAAAIVLVNAPNVLSLDPSTVALLLALLILTETRVLELFAASTYSISAVPKIAAGMLLGVPGAVVVALACALLRGVIRRSRWYKVLFNAGVYVIASSATAWVFGQFVMSLSPSNLAAHLVPAGLAGLVYYGHTFLVSFGVSTELRMAPWRVWAEQYRWLWPQYIALSLMAVLLAVAYHEHGVAGAAVFVVPSLMMHFVAKQYLDRTLQDARQVRELSQQLAVEDARRLAEAKYRDIFENAVVGIYQTSPEGRQIAVNAALVHIYGYDSPEEMISSVTDIARQLYVDPHGRAEFLALLDHQGAVSGLEMQYYRKDGSIIWVSESARAVHDAAGQLSHYEGTVVDITERVRAEDQARESAVQLAEQAKVLALLEERERIAMDLHDGVIQSLYAVALGLGAQLRTLNQRAATPAAPAADTAAGLGGQGSSLDTQDLRATLTQTITQINRIIPEIRNYIFGLRLYELGARGLRAGLEALSEELQVNALVRPRIEIADNVEGKLEPLAVANLLHLAREATSNVIRHAGASEVVLRVERLDDHLVFTVHDNGRGFSAEQGVPQEDAIGGATQGLRNMAERARLAGGRVEITSAPGEGTVVRVFVPLTPALPTELLAGPPSETSLKAHTP